MIVPVEDVEEVEEESSAPSSSASLGVSSHWPGMGRGGVGGNEASFAFANCLCRSLILSLCCWWVEVVEVAGVGTEGNIPLEVTMIAGMVVELGPQPSNIHVMWDLLFTLLQDTLA